MMDAQCFEGPVPERPWDASDEYCTDCDEDPCACDDDDEDWCEMCGDERPCECDQQLKELR